MSLYHGTAMDNLESILSAGLLKSKANYWQGAGGAIYLTATAKDAAHYGVVIEVDVHDLYVTQISDWEFVCWEDIPADRLTTLNGDRLMATIEDLRKEHEARLGLLMQLYKNGPSRQSVWVDPLSAFVEMKSLGLLSLTPIKSTNYSYWQLTSAGCDAIKRTEELATSFVTCPFCDGKGQREYPDSEIDDCAECNGEGMMDFVELLILDEAD